MSHMNAAIAITLALNAALLLPIGNVLEAAGHNMPNTAGKVLRVAGQVIQSAGTFLMAAPFVKTTTARILFTALALPIGTAIVRAIAGNESTVGKATKIIDTVIRIAMKVVNIALAIVLAQLVTPWAIALVVLQVYNLTNEECIKEASRTLLRKGAAFIHA